MSTNSIFYSSIGDTTAAWYNAGLIPVKYGSLVIQRLELPKRTVLTCIPVFDGNNYKEYRAICLDSNSIFEVSEWFDASAYNKGDVIDTSSASIWSFGTLTINNTVICSYIPLDKPINGTQKLEITSLAIRQNGKYLIGSGTSEETNLANISIDSYIMPGVGVRFTLTKSDGFGGTNNDMVSIAMKFKITIS